MLDSLFGRKPEFEIVEMRSEHCPTVSDLHALRFPRPWGGDEFHSLLSQSNVFGFVARQSNAVFGAPLAGFVLARNVAGEAEVLTVAVQAKLSRFGIGWRLMQAVLRELSVQGAEALFLEVDDGNHPALGLYRKLGFVKVGERPAYYTDKNGRRSTALVMRRDLR